MAKRTTKTPKFSAWDLFRHGMRRVNVSLDTRDPEKFRAITRWGDLAKVLDGIAAAQAAGLAVKLNMVALKDVNEHEITDMLEWCHGQGIDLTLIETMPLGDIDGDRTDQYLPLSLVRARLAEAGVRYIQVSTGNVWDQHGGLPRGIKVQCQETDQASAALVSALGYRSVAAVIGHLIGTPLNVISGRAGLIRANPQSESVTDHAIRIEDQAHRLAQRIRHLIEYLTAPVPGPTPTPLATVVADSVSLYQPIAAHRAVEIRIDATSLPDVDVDSTSTLVTLTSHPTGASGAKWGKITS